VKAVLRLSFKPRAEFPQLRDEIQHQGRPA
jgi:hypothetical protein